MRTPLTTALTSARFIPASLIVGGVGRIRPWNIRFVSFLRCRNCILTGWVGLVHPTRPELMPLRTCWTHRVCMARSILLSFSLSV